MKTNVFVKTTNVKRFVGLMEDLKKLPPNIPKLALVYGDHGLGKTKTLLWWATKNDAIYIRANNDITQNGLLKNIMEELEIKPFHAMQDNYNEIIKRLRLAPKIIIVDEVDYLIGSKNAIEIIRDIQDNTGSPIVLSGMGFVDKKISRLKHFDDRLFKKLRFEHYNEEDLRDILIQITDLEFSDDAITYLATRTNRFRQLVKTISKAEQIAKSNGIKEIDEITLKEVLKNDEIDTEEIEFSNENS